MFRVLLTFTWPNKTEQLLFQCICTKTMPDAKASIQAMTAKVVNMTVNMTAAQQHQEVCACSNIHVTRCVYFFVLKIS